MPVDRDQLISRYPKQFEPGRQWTNEFEVAIAKQMLLDIHEIFGKAAIPFWPFFGTFLGIYRDGGLIPWDGDIDIAVYEEDRERIYKTEMSFIERGYEMFGICEPALIIICKEGEHADLSAFHLSGADRCWANFPISASAFDNENTIKCFGKTWRIVSEPERCLAYLYGDNWKTPIKGMIISGPMGQW